MMKQVKWIALVMLLAGMAWYSLGTEGGTGQAAETADLPESKQVTIYIEGMPEEKTLYLHQAQHLGFYTYIPEDMKAENREDAFISTFRWSHPHEVRVEIVARDGLTSAEEMKRFVTDRLKGDDFTLEDPPSKRFGFSLEEYRLNHPELFGRISIFQHDQRFYALIYHYPPEYGDGFEPRLEVILDELVWYDSFK